MKTILVQYQVKPENKAENINFIEGVFAELKAKLPSNVQYAAMLLEDSLSFVHLAHITTADGSNPIAELEAFKQFVADISDRCTVKPQANAVKVIGNYQLLQQG